MAEKREGISDSLIERLNFFWTCIILLVFISTVGFMRFVSPTSTITCWTPLQFDAAHVAYTHQACWNTENLVVLNKSVPEPLSPPGKSNILDVPIVSIILCMIIGFKIPQLCKLLADVFSGKGRQLVRDANYESSDNTLTLIVQESIQQGSNLRFVGFVIVNALVIFNLFIQFVFVSTYFQETTITETIQTRNSSGFYENVTLERTPYFIFPKTVHCFFQIRQLGNIHEYSIQCDLPLHYACEMFFYLFRIWIIFLGVVTLTECIAQIASFQVRPLRDLRFGKITAGAQKLSLDTLLLLRDIESQYGSFITRRVTSQLTLPSNTETAQRSAYEEIPLITIQQQQQANPEPQKIKFIET